ncbi:C6 finger domain protein [Aspergillus bombycis]|uniref:C6 finger domain protein n=1 Tax=Aspergillus bombycis TaxID=109264 RepID=A0A1F8ABL1_9EURO|nr:C6 finger domain protein [Aspergillus bombycis]OGM49116.1 C6 finger domain protein [Aspergillus bombycis]
MAETADPASTPGELPKQAAEPTDALAAPTSTSVEDSTFSAVDVSLPPIDKSLPAMDTPVTSVDTTLPPLDPSIPSLPPIDTSLPPIDTTLPATDGGLGTDTHFSFEDPDPKHDDGGLGGPEPTTHVSATPGSNIGEQPGPSPAPDSSWQLPSNGTHSHHLPPLQNQPAQPQSQPQYQQQQQQHVPQQQHAPSQQYQPQQTQQQGQMQSQPQSQQYQQQSSDMYHNHQAGSTPMNAPSMQTMDHGQTSHVPQAPIGSPMPAMASCDEGHPVCRNCVKSKRECLGYDPVFKQQPTPSAIQPAPNPHPSLVVNPQDPSTSSSTPTYPAAPPGYVPAVSQPFAPSESPSTSTERYDYGAPIDPTLDGNSSSNMASVQNAVEGGLQPTVNPANTTTSSDPTSFRVKQVQISDLLALRGIPPPPPHPITAIQPNRLEEIKAVFLATYAPAIDKFFETRWFQEKALTHLLANAQLMAEYSALIEAFNDQNINDPNVIARLESFEAHGQDYDLLASSKRLDVIESMITGEHVDSNPLAQFPARETPTNPPCLSDQLAQRSLDFWSAIGHFLTLHDNEASSAKEIDDTLGRCRTLLDTFENRDVIYSIAIARHLGQRWADFPRSFPQPITTNEKDAGAKLYVAQKFLEQEAGGKGTTQVIKRICGMVVRSWFVSRE